jgi:hypothetical protein
LFRIAKRADEPGEEIIGEYKRDSQELKQEEHVSIMEYFPWSIYNLQEFAAEDTGQESDDNDKDDTDADGITHIRSHLGIVLCAE